MNVKNTTAKRFRRNSGFTIVELLIVIVVIGILAAISVVAYTGIQDRARSTAAMAAARQVHDQVATYAAGNNGSFPVSLAAIGVSPGGTTTYHYTLNNSVNPPTWCSTATVGNKSFYVSSTQTTPQSGACTGHPNGGAATIINLATNPRAMNFGPISSNNPAIWTLTKNSSNGTTTPDGITTYAESQLNSGQTNQSILSVYNIDGQANNSGKIRSISAWVRVNTTGYAVLAADGFPATPLTANTWTRVQTSSPTAGNEWSGIQIAKTSGNAQAADRAHITGIMSVEGTAHYPFRDGASAGWSWSGTVNNSTSTGSP